MQRCGAAGFGAVVCLLAVEARAERPNEAPRFRDHLIDLAHQPPDDTLRSRPGRAIELDLGAFDRDGDALRYAVEGLPAGATFDPEQAHFTWTPKPADIGRHLLVFSASDREHTVQKSVLLLVEANHAPVAAERNGELVAVMVGSPYWMRIAVEPDSEAISFDARGVPPGIEFEVRGNELHFRYQARPEDVGEHEFTVIASDGELRTPIRQRFVVYERSDARDWHMYLAPGFGYATYVPFEGGGSYHGFRVELTFVARRNARLQAMRCEQAEERESCGMSHLRFYAAMEAQYSTRSGTGPLGAYTLGFTRSFEVNPDRSYLIPHYALEFGLVSPEASPLLFELVPALGVHVVTSRPFWLDATLGLRLVPTRLQTMLGPHAGLTLTIDAI